MGRATSQYLKEDQASQRAEWGELRTELVALLDQVEDQVARSGSGLDGLTERMRDLRHQIAEPEADRQREPVRQPRRSVERYAEPEDEMAPPLRNPRENLENAIQQIRARQLARAEEPRRVAVETGPRFEDMARSVAGMTDRLGRLEAELRTQARGQTANVKEIADQVGQLSQVVELLAGAVGETGQVKRLEGQIASLARLISDERQADANALSTRIDEVATTVAALARFHTDPGRETALVDRLDDLSATVARLVDIQPALAQRSDTSGLAQRLEDVTMTVGRLADLQVQFAERTNTATLATRIDDVNGTISRLTEILADPARRAETTAFGQRLDDMTASVARIADIQAHLADRTDTSTLGRKIDDIGTTVGKLADLQIQVAQIVDNPRDGVREGLGAIEAGIRNIYDRLDTLERNVPSQSLDDISDQLTRIAAAIKQPQAQPQGLIELIDALNTRIGDVEARGPALDGLTHDVDSLREAVVTAFEPRFAALEQRLSALAERPVEINTTQIEAQVRQLVARMDQTGEQLSGLARLYQAPADPVEPDYAQLAEEIAARTQALQRDLPLPGITPDFDELERRIAAMIEAQVMPTPTDADPSDRAALKATIEEVNDRLKRLEAAIAARSHESAPLPVTPLIDVQEQAYTAPVAPARAPEPAIVDAPAGTELESPAMPAQAPEPDALDFPFAPTRVEVSDPIAPLLRSLADEDAFHSAELRSVGPQARDAMPAHPGNDAPLIDVPFDAPVAAEKPKTSRPRHPGLADAVPAFDPSKIERPAPPRSSLLEDLPMAEPQVQPQVTRGMSAGAPAATISAPDEPSDPIARIRRNARANAAKKQTSVGGNSLIGRAFARLQAEEEARATGGSAPPIAAEVPAKPDRTRDRKAEAAVAANSNVETADKAEKASLFAGLVPKRKLAGDKPVPAGRGKRTKLPEAMEPSADAPATAALQPEGDAGAKPESFLLRHRRPILLAAALVAIVCLLVNLLGQQVGSAEADVAATPAAEPAPAAESAAPAPDKLSDATLDPVPMAQQKNLTVTQPRVIPMVDTLETGAIGSSFTTPMSSPAIAAANGLAGAPSLSDQVLPLTATLADPVKADMPPEALGPTDLRMAAASGDMRAQFEIAAIYTEGRAVPEDLGQAAIWYERSASQGFAPAQYRLGSMYERGQGVPRDLQQARLWYQQGAESGNRMAMHNLAALYASGGLGTQQFDAAAKWFEEAASRGLKDSQFNLGMLYARGLGVRQDLPQSYKWFGIAAMHGDKDAAKAQSDIAASLSADVVRSLDSEIAGWKPVEIDLAANFAPIGTWSTSFNPGAAIATNDVVRSVQQALVALGYDVGTPDGVAGPKTEMAIRAFERGTGMSETGAINPRLLAVLGSQPV
jgi:localization factor PodJL